MTNKTTTVDNLSVSWDDTAHNIVTIDAPLDLRTLPASNKRALRKRIEGVTGLRLVGAPSYYRNGTRVRYCT